MLWSGLFQFFLWSLVSPRPLGTTQKMPSTVSTTVTFMFHSFFSPLARSRYLFIFLLSFIFTLWSVRMAEFTRWQFLFFLLNNGRFGLLSESGWSICISKSQIIIIILILIVLTHAYGKSKEFPLDFLCYFSGRHSKNYFLLFQLSHSVPYLFPRHHVLWVALSLMVSSAEK